MRSFTIIFAALAAFASAAPILNGGASVKDVATTHESVHAAVSNRGVVGEVVGKVDSLLQSRDMNPAKLHDEVNGFLPKLHAPATGKRQDLLGSLKNEVGSNPVVSPVETNVNSAVGSLDLRDLLDDVSTRAENTVNGLSGDTLGKLDLTRRDLSLGGATDTVKKIVSGSTSSNVPGEAKNALFGRGSATGVISGLKGLLSEARTEI